MNIAQLKLMGYAVNADGHIECHPGTVTNSFPHSTPRLAQFRTAVIRIDIASGGGKDAATLVDKLIEAADMPRAIIGRGRDGSAVILFRYDGQKVEPSIQGELSSIDGAFKLATRDGAIKLSITCKSVGQTLDVSAYSWAKGRSPLEFERDRLPVLTSDTSALVVNAARDALGCVSWAALDTLRKNAAKEAEFSAKIASGWRPKTTEETQAEEDDALVAQYEGQDVSPWNAGNIGMLVQQARARVATRKAANDPGAREATGLRRFRTMFGG